MLGDVLLSWLLTSRLLLYLCEDCKIRFCSTQYAVGGTEGGTEGAKEW